ncbi:MAG: hypothetical protein M0P13_04775 [Fibrobacteraceae bacterium]|nr:hypothetical protein [Fibrobacteraceae bacterium]
MIRLIALLFTSLALMSCTTTKAMSNFDVATNIKGERVIVITSANKGIAAFAKKVNKALSSSLSKEGVLAEAYSISKDSVALSDNPAMDYAESNHTKYILYQNLEKVTFLNAALYKIGAELYLISVETKKPVWKSDIDFDNAMPMMGSSSAGLKTFSTKPLKF